MMWWDRLIDNQLVYSRIYVCKLIFRTLQCIYIIGFRYTSYMKNVNFKFKLKLVIGHPNLMASTLLAYGKLIQKVVTTVQGNLSLFA